MQGGAAEGRRGVEEGGPVVTYEVPFGSVHQIQFRESKGDKSMSESWRRGEGAKGANKSMAISQRGKARAPQSALA